MTTTTAEITAQINKMYSADADKMLGIMEKAIAYTTIKHWWKKNKKHFRLEAIQRVEMLFEFGSWEPEAIKAITDLENIFAGQVEVNIETKEEV